MSADSIFSNLTAENTAAEIDLILAADIERRRTVILLEGEDDVKVFRFLVSDDVVLIKAYGASTTVDKFIPQRYPDEKRVIGIRDRDYRRERTFPRVFWCDHCCCEMMMAADLDCFSRVAANFYRGPLSPAKLREEVLRKLFRFSLARKLSYELRLALRMSDVDLKRIAAPDVTASARDVLRFVGGYNRKARFGREFVSRLISSPMPADIEEILDITNGHDFVSVLAMYINGSGSKSKTRSVSDRELGGILRCSYSVAAFSRTRLHADLVAYENETGLKITADE